MSLSRRDALKRLAGALAAGSVTPETARAATRLRLDRVGLQLYTVRGAMQTSVETTLARVAEIGYHEVEFAGYFGQSPAQLAALLKQTGLSAPSGHLGLDVMRTAWDRALDEAATIGHRYVVVAFLPPSERSSADAYRRVAEEFNRAGEAAQAKGMTFAYHNHDFEFQPMDGTTGYDVLLETCDPAVVAMELDLYWIRKAGRDPLPYLRAHPGRFPLVHVKDMAADGSMADVGEGTTDFPGIFAAAAGEIRHHFVEHDHPADAFASITASYRHLAGLR
jgi:sugar phosphate isomerase/epimerase